MDDFNAERMIRSWWDTDEAGIERRMRRREEPIDPLLMRGHGIQLPNDNRKHRRTPSTNERYDAFVRSYDPNDRPDSPVVESIVTPDDVS